MTSYQDALVLFALLLRFDKVILPVFTIVISQHMTKMLRLGLPSTLDRLFIRLFSWYDVITCKK